MNYNINEQKLGFDRVLPWEGQVPAVKKKNQDYFLQISAPKAKKVSFLINEKEYLCNKDENGVWKVKYPVEVGIQYVQMLIDDTEVLSPLLPITYGYSRPYNYVALEKEESFYQIQDVLHGSVRREYFFSKTTGEWESCIVYTPYCYETEKEREFPVLYLQHGHGENEIGWTASGKVNFILDNLIAEGKAVPMIVVMCNGMVQTTDANGNRIVDYQLFEKQLLKDVIPYIEEKFRVGKTKEMRAMAGLSMGSIQTSRIGFLHPELFDALGIFSGFVMDFIQGGSLDMVAREASKNEYLRILDDSEKFAKIFSVYFRAMGQEDPFWEYFEQDEKLLKEKNIPQIRQIYPGAHDWNVWRMCIRDFLPLIFKKQE